MIKTKFLSNILLAFVWVALTGTFTLGNFAFGFMICFGIMWLISANRRRDQYFNRIPKIVVFDCYFIYELLKSNLGVASDVISFKKVWMGIIRVTLDAKSYLEITILANLSSLTPRTIIVGISDDRIVVDIHSKRVQNRE